MQQHQDRLCPITVVLICETRPTAYDIVYLVGFVSAFLTA